VPHCAGVANGTDALRFAYLALGVTPGKDEIITVAHTFIATAEAITQAGGVVRFVDITEESMTMDPAAAASAVGPRTVGIVPVHLYGQPADLDPLLALARRRRLWLVEDAAQAHGALYRGRRAGALGDLGCFSFYPGKNLGSLGEGGAVTGADPAVMERVRQLREHGQSSKYVHATEGYNGRLHAIQAAFLRIKLRRLDAGNAARRQVALWYGDALRGVGDLRLPIETASAQHVYHLYVVRTAVRDALREYLGQRGIGTGLHYPVPLHLQRAYERLGLKPGALPVTERTAATCLSLPLFPGMSESQVACVADAVRDYFRARPRNSA
jgi:dTDP-4-amino-4,6-dideoxygalactose transaminase